jgi:hypothetical protein
MGTILIASCLACIAAGLYVTGALIRDFKGLRNRDS